MKRTGRAARRTRPAPERREQNAGAETSSHSPGFWRPALLIVTVALVFRAIHLLQIKDVSIFDLLMGDAQAYDAWGRRIAAGDWIGREVFYQAPLYPYVLGVLYFLFGHSLLLVKICQSAAGAAACGMLGAATARLFGRQAGLVTGLILATYPPAIYFDGLIQKTTLDGFFLCVLLLAIAWVSKIRRVGGSLMAGAALGCLALTRENALAFLPLIAAWLWSRGRPAAKSLAAFLVGVALVLSPVALRNFVIDGALHLTTSQFGPNLYIGNSATATGSYVPLRADHSMPEDERQDAIDLAEQAMGRRLTAGEVSTYWQRRAVEWVVAHPNAWLRLMGKKLMLAWNVVEPADTEDIYTYADRSWPLRLQSILNFGVLAPLGLLGIWMTRDRWRELWFLYGMCLVYTATLALFYVFARYRYPLVPLLAVFAGAAVAGLPARWQRSSVRSRTTAGALTAGTIILCHWPLQSPAAMQSVAHYNIGYALQAQHQADRAIDEYRMAIAKLPGNADAHVNLGGLLTERGDHAGARAHLEEAVRLAPGLAAARTNLGIELAAQGELAAATASFEAALAIDAGDVRARYNLAVALASGGHVAEAIEHLRLVVKTQPTHVDAQNNLGVLLSMSGHPQEAVEHLTAAVAADPSNAELKANLEWAREAARVQRQPANGKKR